MRDFETSGKFSEQQKKRLRIWYSMEPKSRDYDRLVARQIPYGAYWGLETKGAVEAEYQMYKERQDADEDDEG